MTNSDIDNKLLEVAGLVSSVVFLILGFLWDMGFFAK